MAPTYQSLASIAHMPYPGPSNTRTTTTMTTTTTTTTTTVKPKLTLDNLTNYLAQLEQTPTTPLSGAEEPSSTIAECGEATTLAWDYNINRSDLSAAPAARGDRIFNGRQKWKNSIKEEDADEESGGVKDADADADSDSCSSTPTPTSTPPRGTSTYNNNKESNNNNNNNTTQNHDTTDTTTTTTTSEPTPSSPEKQNHEKPQERAPETGGRITSGG